MTSLAGSGSTVHQYSNDCSQLNGCDAEVDHILEQADATTVDLDLTSVFPDAGQGSAYLHAWIDSSTTQQIELSLGVDDGAVIWLNQQELAEIPGPQPFTPNQYKIPVQLEKGENRFCFRIDNIGGAWRIQARFSPLIQQ